MSLKQNKKNHIIFLFLMIYIGFVVLVANLCQRTEEITYDVIQMNRIVKEAEKNWADLSVAGMSSYQYPFAVLNANEELIYQSQAKATVTLAEAMKYGDAIFPAVENERMIGSVIISTHLENLRQRKLISRRNCIFVVCVLLIGLCLLLVYVRYLNQQILKPFLRITRFTKEIAHGNLEVPLTEQGSRVFRPFVQSFELMRDELKTAWKREYEANRSKKELVAALSHDIKTPVTSIRVTVELLMVKVQDDSLKVRLEAILGKVEQIDHLITDLFHTTMEDLEELNVNLSEVYSSELLRLIREADCNECVTLQKIPDCMIVIDPLRMGQVLANIIYNSYKYANTEISITGELEEDYLALSIQDYGQGVNEEELPLLFNRFYRGKNVGSHSGSGLGLYICKRLLEKMSGEIYCSNNEQGFLTLIKIPLVQ